MIRKLRAKKPQESSAPETPHSVGRRKPRTQEPPFPPSSSLSHEDIAARAYLLFLSRGGQHGGDLADWYRAEAELRQARHVTAAQRPSGHRG